MGAVRLRLGHGIRHLLSPALTKAPGGRARLPSGAVHLAELQDLMEQTYGARDRARGTPAAVAWLAEEVGELARAVRKGSAEEQREELADVLAWVATLANLVGIDLESAVSRYAHGCPKCGAMPCRC